MALEICKVMIYYRKNINVEYSIKWRAKNHPQKVLFNWSQIYNRRKAINEGIQLCTRDESLFAFRNTTIEWWNQLSRVLAEKFANIRPQQCTSRELQQRHFKKQPKLTLFVQCFIYFVFLFDIRSKRENFFSAQEKLSREIDAAKLLVFGAKHQINIFVAFFFVRSPSVCWSRVEDPGSPKLRP